MSRLLQDAGLALYGQLWQSALARDLGISDRTMRRWAASAEDVPPGVHMDLMRLTMERAQALDALTERLRAAASP